MKTTRFAALLALYLEAPMGFGLLSMKLRRTLPLSLTSPGLRLRFKVQCRVRTLMLNQDPHRSAPWGSNPTAGSTPLGDWVRTPATSQT